MKTRASAEGDNDENLDENARRTSGFGHRRRTRVIATDLQPPHETASKIGPEAYALALDVDEIYTEDVVFYDPSKGAYRGRDEIDRIAGILRATHPDFTYLLIAEPDQPRFPHSP